MMTERSSVLPLVLPTDNAMSSDEVLTRIRALLITGPSGVGKTTIAHEVAALLRKRKIAHALIDIDELVRVFPPPSGEPRLTRLAGLNLAALWSNYRAAGVRRVIVAGVIESLEFDLALIRASVPEASFTVFRLRASGEALRERLSRRRLDAGFDEHLRRSIALSRRMDGEAASACVVVETTGREIGEVADDILARCGWR